MISLKGAEKRLKNILERVVYSGKPPIVINKPSDYVKLSDDSQILFLRQDRIGDVLISIPTFILLKKKFPNLKMDILLSENNISTKAALSKYFRNIYIYQKNIFAFDKLLHKLRRTNYTAIVDLLAKPSLTSAIFTKFLKAQNKVAINNSGNIYTHVIEDPGKATRHIVERTAYALKAFGIESDSETLFMEYDLSHEIIKNIESGIDQNKFTLGINLSGSSKTRFWGTQNNIDFINQVTSKYSNIEFVILAVPDYYDIAETIISRTNPANVRLVKTACLDEFSGTISLCDALLTPDTSAVQFSAAFKVPCIALYNNYRKNSNEMPWFPYKAEQFSIEGTSNLMSDIAPSTIFDKFELIYNDYLSGKSKSPNS